MRWLKAISEAGDQKNENKYDRVQTSDAFWWSACVLVSESSLKWYSFIIPMPLCSNSSQKFNLCVTDGRTDTPTYRDARMHLECDGSLGNGSCRKAVVSFKKIDGKCLVAAINIMRWTKCQEVFRSISWFCQKSSLVSLISDPETCVIPETPQRYIEGTGGCK